jgi:hypothetical protein
MSSRIPAATDQPIRNRLETMKPQNATGYEHISVASTAPRGARPKARRTTCA